jgi:hypothetical protein
MIRIQLLIPGAVVLAIFILHWISLHISLRNTLPLTPMADRWRVYREFARSHRLGAGGIVLVFKIFRKVEERAPVLWAQRSRGQGPR